MKKLMYRKFQERCVGLKGKKKTKTVRDASHILYSWGISWREKEIKNFKENHKNCLTFQYYLAVLDAYGHLDVWLAYSVFKVDRKNMNYSTKPLLPPPPFILLTFPPPLKLSLIALKDMVYLCVKIRNTITTHMWVHFCPFLQPWLVCCL